MISEITAKSSILVLCPMLETPVIHWFVKRWGEVERQKAERLEARGGGHRVKPRRAGAGFEGEGRRWFGKPVLP